jgi:hypothetical protein
LSGPTRVTSQDQAAAVLVTPGDAQPLSEVSEALAPRFSMSSGDAALAKVLPTTERITEQVLNAFGLSLGLGLPTTSTTSNMTSGHTSSSNSSTTGQTTTSTSASGETGSDTTTTAHAPGTAPSVPTGTPTGATLPNAAAPTGDIGLDPVLQYKSANYLYQTVQLLNRQVQALAVRECYIPFVTQLKLTVMPYRARLGYSLHTRIAFFPADATLDDSPVKANADLRPGCDGTRRTPIVIPLLAADDLQLAARTRAMEAAQQIGLALSGMIHGAGLSVGANNVNQTMRAILNRDISSSLTVGREADNSLYVRIAPNNEASEQPSLVGQSYDVAVLLLVPSGYYQAGKPRPELAVDTFTEFRDALDGSRLPQRPIQARNARLSSIVPFYLDSAGRETWSTLTGDEMDAAARTLIGPIQTGNYGKFRTALRNVLDGCSGICPHSGLSVRDSYANTLWTALTSMLDDSPVKTAKLGLPPLPIISVGQQDAVMTDDGKANAVVVLGNVRKGDAGLSARLIVKGARENGKPSRNLELAALNTVYDPLQETLKLTFPSPARLGVKTLAASGNRVVLSLKPCDQTQFCPRFEGNAIEIFRSIAAVVPEAEAKSEAKAAAPFKLAARNTVVVAGRDGIGTVVLVASKIPAGAKLLVDVAGADVAAVTDAQGSAIVPEEGGYPIGADGRYGFRLFNLIDDSSVTFTAEGRKGNDTIGTTNATVRVRTR